MARTKTAERQQVKFTSKDFVKQNSNPTPVDSADLRLFCNAHGFQEMSDEEEPVAFRPWFVMQGADRTLDNNTNTQKIFDQTTNGAITLDAGYYEFSALVYVTGMSSTSGNARFDIIGSGTATLDANLMQVMGQDQTAFQVGTISGIASVSAATNWPMITAATGTLLTFSVRGYCLLSASGTIIPSIGLQNAAAATIKKGSTFVIRKLNGLSSGSYFGPWS